MLNITYAEKDKAVAEKLQQDLSQKHLKLMNDILLVLVSPEALEEEAVQKAITEAVEQKHKIVPVIIRETTLPPQIANVETVDFTQGYKLKALIYHINAIDAGKKSGAKLGFSNRVATYVLVAIVIGMFIISLLGVGGGLFAFPEAEYNNTEATFEAQRDIRIRPTLEAFEPRTTQDAQNFPSTVEAVPTYIRPFLKVTATALVSGEATEEAESE